jgi:hypothetical protein
LFELCQKPHGAAFRSKAKRRAQLFHARHAVRPCVVRFDGAKAGKLFCSQSDSFGGFFAFHGQISQIRAFQRQI